MLQSFLTTPPPIHPDDLGLPPSSILLDTAGYISDRTNATTAEGFTSAKKPITVTFWAAHPPRGSCFTVYSPVLKPSAFGGAPKILSTVDDLVLLRFPICRPSCVTSPWRNNYFVYQAGAENKGPSLDLIPTPPPFYFSDYQVGLLRCRDMYFIAILQRAALGKGQYDLHLYSSETGTWRTKLMHLDSRQKLLYICCNKVITIGGELGSMGWVDLLRGILICDILVDNRELRYIPLPSAEVPIGRSPSRVRDVIVLQGHIKYFEMFLHMDDQGWDAVAWTRKDSWKEWKKDSVIKVSEEEDSVQVAEQLTLKGSYSGHPVLSLHDAGVVYIMDRQGCPGIKASVISVDMRKQTLKGVADYGSGRPMGYNFALCGSEISKHLRWTSSASEIMQACVQEVQEFPRQRVQSQLHREQEVQEFPRECVQSQLYKVHETSRKCKCRGRRGRHQIKSK